MSLSCGITTKLSFEREGGVDKGGRDFSGEVSRKCPCDFFLSMNVMLGR